MNQLAKLFIPVSLLTWLCVEYVDRPVALFVRDWLYGNSHWSKMTRALPDTLLTVVVVISSAAYLGHVYRKNRRLFDSQTLLLKHIALSLPVAYLVRGGLKIVFGRVVTRAWVRNPDYYAFHWFGGTAGFNGFPSGHMIVFATLAAAISRYHPGCKPACYGLLGLLALLLVATNYHFVGDVVFGWYAGLLIEACMHRLLRGEAE